MTSVCLATDSRFAAGVEVGGTFDTVPAVAAEQIAGAAFGFAGQKCTATKRIIVVGDPARFRGAFVAIVERLGIGDPSVASTVVGPVIDEPARQRVLAAAREGADGGGRILIGGRAPSGETGCAGGWFVAPTVD